MFPLDNLTIKPASILDRVLAWIAQRDEESDFLKSRREAFSSQVLATIEERCGEDGKTA